ncbi:MAG: LPS ABC transporter substrate-binding protein LptA [Variibacter sp.]|nr:LPS ABC transporter substrate-binding protein LptA [Variibacter sp.]
MKLRAFLRSGCTAVAFVFALPAAAQPYGPPNAVQGFSQNRGQPIKIESNSLEVRDKEQIAYFIDNVRVTQGDTVLECKKLVIFYEGGEADKTDGKAGAKPRQAAPAIAGSSQQIKRLEAKGGVVVTQKDQTATGEDGVYDMKNNSMTLIGNVVVMQGQNVIRGDRLWVDLKTGVSRIETTGGATGRVQAVILPNQAPPAAATAPQQPASRAPHGPRAQGTAEREKPARQQNRPMRLN